MSLLIALILGVLCGAIPVILGAIMEELEVGVLGFVASCVSALFLVYTALFLLLFCAHFIYYATLAQNNLALTTWRKLSRSRLNGAVELLAYNYKNEIYLPK